MINVFNSIYNINLLLFFCTVFQGSSDYRFIIETDNVYEIFHTKKYC